MSRSPGIAKLRLPAPAAARCSAASRLLSLLHLLHLLRVSLLQLLRLLLMPLLHLLDFRGSSILSRQLLMFLVLLLLEFLPILVLLRDYLLLLLLVFLVHLRVPGVGSGALDGRQVLRMGRKVGASSRGNWRRTTVRRNPLLGVIVCRPRMLSLSGYRSDMSSPRSSLFFRSGARVDPAVTAVEADAVSRRVHPGVVNVVDGAGVHAIHRRVVEKCPFSQRPPS